jgi:very-short-patch-repair endonuclease
MRHGAVVPRRPQPLPEPLLWGPFTVAEARKQGLPPGRLRAADLAAPFRGVRTPGPVDSLRGLCEAYAARMPPGQYFSHLTAAQLWGFPLPRRLEGAPLHVSVAAPAREPRMRGVVGRRGTAGAGIRLLFALPVLAPADTWFQLARFLGPDELIVAGDRLFKWRDHLVTRAELAEAGERLSQQAGIRRARLALRELRENSNSPRETRLRLEVLRAGFPEPELNGEIVLGDGRRTWGDLVFRKWRTLLEFDGEQHRTQDRQWRRDVDRLNDLVEHGWLTTRVRRDSTDHLARLERNLRRRGWRR